MQVQPGNIEVVNVASTVANGQVVCGPLDATIESDQLRSRCTNDILQWILKGVRNYA